MPSSRMVSMSSEALVHLGLKRHGFTVPVNHVVAQIQVKAVSFSGQILLGQFKKSFFRSTRVLV